MTETAVVKACKKHWEKNKHECNFFVQAVAAELLVLIPGGDADSMSWWLQNWFNASGVFITIPRGPHAAAHAIGYANMGKFVIAGMTRDYLDKAHHWHPPQVQSRHGHVAVVT